MIIFTDKRTSGICVFTFKGSLKAPQNLNRGLNQCLRIHRDKIYLDIL